MSRISRRAALFGSAALVAGAPRAARALAVGATPVAAQDVALAADAFLGLGGRFAEAAAQRMAAVLVNAAAEGLDPAHYVPGSDQRGLVFAVAQYAHDLGRGRITALPNRPDMVRAPPERHLADTLAAIAASPDPAAALVGLAPATPLYAALKAELARTRTAAGWPDFPSGSTLNPGTRDARVVAVRERLAAFDPTLPPGADATHYDPALVLVAKRFQAAHGLDADGKLGRFSQALLAEQPAARAARLAANMDALRGLAPPPPELVIEVNVPAYRLVAAEGLREVLSMKVVLGRPSRPTPLMLTRMTGAVFNPPWGVPQTIAKEDMLPRLRADPTALTARGFRLFGAGGVEVDPTTVDWRAVRADRFPFVLRQDPGDTNALGRVKFNLVNNQDIYMHDTPERRYFATDIRAFSSGCIRLERPLEMLDLLMAENNIDRPRLQALIDRRTTSGLAARRPIPARLAYRTAGLDAADALVLRLDIYGLDAAYARAMAGDATHA
jgi:murein L,D-transpeptidase YcbB/YkuD